MFTCILPLSLSRWKRNSSGNPSNLSSPSPTLPFRWLRAYFNPPGHNYTTQEGVCQLVLCPSAQTQQFGCKPRFVKLNYARQNSNSECSGSDPWNPEALLGNRVGPACFHVNTSCHLPSLLRAFVWWHKGGWSCGHLAQIEAVSKLPSRHYYLKTGKKK